MFEEWPWGFGNSKCAIYEVSWSRGCRSRYSSSAVVLGMLHKCNGKGRGGLKYGVAGYHQSFDILHLPHDIGRIGNKPVLLIYLAPNQTDMRSELGGIGEFCRALVDQCLPKLDTFQRSSLALSSSFPLRGCSDCYAPGMLEQS